MSHIVEIRTEVRDPEAVAAACRRLGLPAPEAGTAQLYSGAVSGLLIRLPGWAYPAVVDTASGAVLYDNYGGLWGDPGHLDRFLQRYAVERATIEARRRGHSVVEQPLPDGSIKLTIGVGGWRVRTIELIVDAKGATRVETKGFSGPACREASRFVEEAMGAHAAERPTAEYYQEQPARQDARQGG